MPASAMSTVLYMRSAYSMIVVCVRQACGLRTAGLWSVNRYSFHRYRQLNVCVCVGAYVPISY